MRDGHLKHDKFCVFHEDDPDLTPIVLRLPEPPDLHLIDGYKLPVLEQEFRRLEIPMRLKYLEERAIKELKEENRGTKQYALTLYKIQKRFWDILEREHDKFTQEIAFIRRVWYHRIHGYWFYNFGKPTWITGLHFDYLNFWSLPTSEGDNIPAYRDRNRKEYVFKEYALTCSETFKHLDENGFAIKKDGKYHMLDMGRRIVFGVIQPKNRRGGNTNMGASDSFSFLVRNGKMSDGVGFMSYSGDNAGETFRVKTVPAFKKFPIWIQPLTKTITEDNITFAAEKNDYGVKSLETKLTYATTMDSKFYDSKRLVYAFMDEEGKTDTSIIKRWDVVKNCLSQGNGRLIHGFTYHPSTVEDMGEGANDFAGLCQDSDFYRRMPDGKTISGMLRLFIPASEGLDSFIDPYGYSVKDEILQYQRSFGFMETAVTYLQKERDALVKDGSPTAMSKYRHLKKLFPLKYSDSFLGDTGEIGFDYEKIDQRIPHIRSNPRILRGNFEWEKGIFGGTVNFIEDDQGVFQISKKQDPRLQEKIKVMQYSTFEDDEVAMYAPRYPGTNVMGVDPFRFTNKQQSLMTQRRVGNKSRLSDGGIAVLEVYNPEVDKDKAREQWSTERFVLSYRHRGRSSDEFNEDVLKAAIYTGSMIYPENNVEITFEYLVRRGYGGYLLYDVDPMTGRMRDKPGVFNLEASKMKLFSLLRDYIHYHCHKEEFYEFLQECKDIRGMEEMRMYDRLTSHGLALMGAQSIQPYKIYYGGETMQSFDLQDYIEEFNV